MVDNSSAEGHRREEQGRPQGGAARGMRREVASEAARILTRALDRVEDVLNRAEGYSGGRLSAAQPPGEEANGADLSELRRSLRHALDRLEDAIDHVGIEEQRLSDQVAELGLLSQRLERRLDGIARLLEHAVGRLAPAEREAIREAAPTPQEIEEPCFTAGSGVGLVISDVPGFQGLMEVQRGLSRLPAVESASVKRYQNGEASVEVMLREPATASEIVDAIGAATGASLLIEEARPEASRLRLRFAASTA